MNHNYSLFKEFGQRWLFSMFGATFIPAGHLAFDHSRIDPIATRRNSLATDLPDDRFIPLGERRSAIGIAFG